LIRLLFLLVVSCAVSSAHARELPAVESNPSHVAVVLPLASPSFKKYASAVLRGVLAAASIDASNLPVYVYETNNQRDAVLLEYDRAVAEGAAAVIGPLTRSGVAALASRDGLPVPTIALNVPDGEPHALPKQLYLFGLQIESEARQVAEYAFAQGKRSAFIVASKAPLERRIAEAFKQAWTEVSGIVADEFEYSTGVGTIGRLQHALRASDADMVFLAMNEPRIRFIRPYLTDVDSVFATSLVFSNTDPAKLYDLQGVAFVDMPWLLEPDHPAVATYARPETRSSWLDEERFHAIGIDAYRLAEAMAREPAWRGALKGVTGSIVVENNQTISRVLIPAQFSGGAAHPLPPAPVIAGKESPEQH
jgi:outer membrane PBP1 activator LpoA protein